MFLYNVSVIAEETIHQEIVTWILDNVVQSQKFEVHFLQMLQSPHEGMTYCIQVVLPSEEHIADFQQVHLLPLQELVAETYQDKVFLFDSTMKYLKK
ncbi:DUF4286 family protein [Sphingobacterium sp. InxBP1]|uniref:DUF4286 family protein n=1 Tax=Sphingobacterium sp. InxBP1 TaxID=2870328 RepID=UPI002244184B|nr:DUF4286 family protein [Sphingobacterium sp. InxBP1]MCW8310046.1 DUF4286 family protein [Sphingobacterium sp. InxBP1]